MNIIAKILGVGVVLSLTAFTASAARLKLPENDYPTEARADYVFACMQVNGQTPEVLQHCSCSIDQIAALVPYEKYEEARTIMSLIQKGGEKVAWARNPAMERKVNDVKRAQVEGELRCF